MYNEIICNFDNLYEAYKLAHRGKGNSLDVIDFDEDKLYNLNKLRKDLLAKNWDKIFIYYRFTITEPKERIVDALRFEGRIVQHVLCDKILKPYFDKRLIKENCACRVGKGTDYAIKLLKQHMVKYKDKYIKKNNCYLSDKPINGYVLKMDVKKYFPSIDRDILKNLISDFPDDEIKEFLYWIIDHSPDGNGLPIGNQTSQWFALYYLNSIDRLIKEKFRVKYYVRYMDDLIIIHEDKKYLHKILDCLTEYASEKLHIKFNGKTQITPIHKGISFLGWKFFYTKTNKVILHISNDKKQHRKRVIKELLRRLTNYEISNSEFIDIMLSIKAYLKKGSTYQFQEKITPPNISIRFSNISYYHEKIHSKKNKHKYNNKWCKLDYENIIILDW